MDDLERLIAAEEIRGVMARYVYNADHKEWAALAALFAPEAPFTAYAVDGTVQVQMHGPEQIASELTQRNPEGTVLVHHLFSDLIEVNGADSASGVWAMEDIVKAAPTGSETAPEMHGYGHYRVQFTKHSGQWRIAGLEITRLRLDWTR